MRDYRQLAPIAELSPGQLCPGYGSKVTIRVHAYVTQGTKGDVSTLDYSRVDVAETDSDRIAVQPMRAQVGITKLPSIELFPKAGENGFGHIKQSWVSCRVEPSSPYLLHLVL